LENVFELRGRFVPRENFPSTRAKSPLWKLSDLVHSEMESLMSTTEDITVLVHVLHRAKRDNTKDHWH